MDTGPRPKQCGIRLLRHAWNKAYISLGLSLAAGPRAQPSVRFWRVGLNMARTLPILRLRQGRVLSAESAKRLPLADRAPPNVRAPRITDGLAPMQSTASGYHGWIMTWRCTPQRPLRSSNPCLTRVVTHNLLPVAKTWLARLLYFASIGQLRAGIYSQHSLVPEVVVARNSR